MDRWQVGGRWWQRWVAGRWQVVAKMGGRWWQRWVAGRWQVVAKMGGRGGKVRRF